MKRKRWLSSLIAILMVLALAACGAPAAGDSQAPAQGQSEGAPAPEGAAETTGEVVEITMLVPLTGQGMNEYPDTPVRKKMEEDIGVRFTLIESDPEKYNLLLSSDDLPDIVFGNLNTVLPLIEAGKVTPMDPYLETYGQDILSNIPEMVDFSREFWSNGTGNLYFLPHQLDIGEIGTDRIYENGVAVRWDLYEAVGYPDPQNVDEIIDMVEQMVAVAPTTEDGQKVYGWSFGVDFGNWWQNEWTQWMHNLSSYGNVWVDCTTKEHVNQFTDERGRLTALEFWFKVSQRGLLDPDSLTQNYTDMTAKYTAGRAVASAFNWGWGTWNDEHPDAKGVIIPISWGMRRDFGYNPVGWNDKIYNITTSCKNPEAAMKYINYMFNYDACRGLYSGVEGVHWDFVDGKPTLRQEAVDLFVNGGEPLNEVGFFAAPGDLNYVGIGTKVTHPDGYPLNLFLDSSMFATMNDPTDAKYSAHYGVSYPGEAYDKVIAENNMKTTGSLDMRVNALWPADPEDISLIYANLDDLYARQGAKMVLAADQAEYDALKAELLEQAKELGVEQWNEYINTTYQGILNDLEELDAR